MEGTIIEFYKWHNQVKNAISKEMGINPDTFRNCHIEYNGHRYNVDLWIEWMNYFESEVRNGAIVYNDIGENLESKLQWIREDGKEYLEEFVRAVYAVWDRYEIEYIKYSW